MKTIHIFRWFGKTVALLLAALFLLSGPAACSGKQGQAALEADGVRISMATYRYWLSSFKYYFVTRYEDITDTLECWNKDTGNGQTIGEYVEEYTMQYAKTALCALKLFRDYGLKLDQTKLDDIDESINEIIYYQFDDSRSRFNTALNRTYGIGIDELREAFRIEARVDAVEAYMFGDDGIALPGEDEYRAFYENNYRAVQTITIHTTFSYERGEDGSVLLDENGAYKTTALDEEQTLAQKQKAQEAYTKALQGESFSGLIGTYDESPQKNVLLYLCPQAFESLVRSGYDSAFLSSLLQMEENEVVLSHLQDADVVAKRVALPAGGYLDADTAGQFSSLKEYVVTEKYDAMLAPIREKIVVSQEAEQLKTIDVQKGFI